MWIVLTIIFIFLPILWIGRSNLKTNALIDVTSMRFLLMYFFVPTAFGVFGTYFNAIEFSFGTHSLLSESKVSIVFYQYLLATFLILIMFWLSRGSFQRFEGIFSASFKHQKSCTIFSIFMIFVAFCLFIFELIRIPSIPLLVLVTDGIWAASVSRGEVIDYQIVHGIPLLGYMINHMPSILFCWLIVSPNIASFIKIIYSVIFIAFNILFLAKGFFLTPILLIIVSRWILWKSSSLMIFVVASIILLASFFSVTDNISDALGLLLQRLFVGQVEGLFLIREFYPQMDINATTYGMPLAKFFGINGFDPSVEIVNKVFGDVPGWVNMNSFGLGQGFVMLGHSIVILLPILVWLNLFFMYSIARVYEKLIKNGFSLIVALYYAFILPINTNFSLLLYFKSLVGMLVILNFVAIVRFATMNRRHAST